MIIGLESMTRMNRIGSRRIPPVIFIRVVFVFFVIADCDKYEELIWVYKRCFKLSVSYMLIVLKISVSYYRSKALCDDWRIRIHGIRPVGEDRVIESSRRTLGDANMMPFH